MAFLGKGMDEPKVDCLCSTNVPRNQEAFKLLVASKQQVRYGLPKSLTTSTVRNS